MISTSGADDRFEVVPQVLWMRSSPRSYQDAGRDVIVDLASRDEGVGYGDGGSAGETWVLVEETTAEQTAQVDINAWGMWFI